MSIHEHNHPYKTIHDFYSHVHYGWDNSLTPITEVELGQTVNYEIIEASGGQFMRHSTPENVGNIDFAKVNPVAGPIYIKNVMPGDTLEIEMIDFRQLDWGWTAIEASMETTIKFALHKGKTIKEPRYEIPGPSTSEADSQGCFVTTGQGLDLYEASQKAISYMIEHLIDMYGLKDSEAYMLCSISVDLKINEIVNAPNYLVSVFLPNSIFK